MISAIGLEVRIPGCDATEGRAVRVLLTSKQAVFLSVNNTARGVIYVSVWVVIWGTASSLVDWVLLNADLYETGSFGQAATFIGYGAAAAVLAVKLSQRFLSQAPDDDASAD